MKILFLILGILFTQTSESFSYVNNISNIRLPDPPQEKVRKFPESDKASLEPDSSNIEWMWGSRILLSPSEQLYLEAEEDEAMTDWLWGNAKQLEPNENLEMPRQLTYPNWVQNVDSPIKPLSKKKSQPEGGVFLTADHMTHDNNRNLIWAWGNVIIDMEDRVIKADKVKVNNNTGNGQAVGHVRIIRNDGTRLKAKRTRFNIDNQQGRIFETRGRVGKQFYIKGKEITRYSNTHFTAQKGHLTTCEGALPDWLFEAESMDIVMGDRVFFKNGIFKIKNFPILYFPIGYLPIDQERKSGFLVPSWSTGGNEGVVVNNAYYWAIDKHSDATFGLDYSQNRGIKPVLEYRYTPSLTTAGTVNASFIDDKLTGSTFWQVQAEHRQKLPFDFNFNGVLDLRSQEFNRNFTDNSSIRSVRNTDSYANITKTWEGSSLDVLTRYRDSSQAGSDQTFAQLPQITYKTQRQPVKKLMRSFFNNDSCDTKLNENNKVKKQINDISQTQQSDQQKDTCRKNNSVKRGTELLFNQDSSFASFLTDLNSDPDIDDNYSVQRFDFHPQFTYPMRIAPWLSFTPTLGFRETIYSRGLDTTNNNERLDFFTRESFDINASIEGPRFEKVFEFKNKNVPKVKHLLEPRITYNFIPDIDENDREKIRVFDGNDTINRQSTITYSLTQRLLQKERDKEGNYNTRESVRFDISQTLDLIEATGGEDSENKRPFTDLRFDMDSRVHDNLEFNFDSTFNIYDKTLQTFNAEVGLKPVDSLYLYLQRRFTKDQTTFY
ncbi:MAG: LPS assembly protein LptD, partial [Nitrospinae bacterium]|nr:LPS assembly protein LptD [Nitrospinota bacterium]